MAKGFDPTTDLALRCAAYEVLHRRDPRLPALVLDDGGPDDAARALRRCFAEARRSALDARAAANLFAEDVDVDGLTPVALSRLAATVARTRRALAEDPAGDPLGPLFESISAEETRRQKGQHFTPAAVVSLALELARAEQAPNVLDPTCGTGAFLTRAATLPGQRTLWGCELDPRAAALTRVNLAPTPSAPPAHVHTGDLLTLQPGSRMGDATLPRCEAVVGNLPYVRLHRHAAARWRRVLGERWAPRDPSLVKGSRRPSLRLSGHADLYALLFFHLADLVAPGGRLALLTANAYLDADYGAALKSLFLRHFHLVAVVETRAEPWFSDASVNTVITVLERRAGDKPVETGKSPTCFVQLTQPLVARPGAPPPADPRAVAQAVSEAATGSRPGRAVPDYVEVRSPQCRIRVVEGTALRQTLAAEDLPWSAYLRAPDLYFRLRRHPDLRPLGELVQVRRGVTTNWNAFFYPPDHAGIESEYLRPVVRSPRVGRTVALETDTLEHRIFLCTRSADELARASHHGALAWIEGGGQMRNRQGRPISETLQNRPWYGLEPTPHRLLLTKTTHDTHLHRLADRPVILDQRLYGVTPRDPADTELVAALLNTSLTALMTEVVGVASLGDGALDLPVTVARKRLLLPAPDRLSGTARAAVLAAFGPLTTRPVGPVSDEVNRPDRQALDRAVLSALELDVEPVLAELYDGLRRLTHERLTLAQRRRQVQATA